jgi:hypothetical protein
MVQQGEVTFDSAMTRLKKFVYKTRLRLKDFIVDFDKLRCGEISPAQFKSGLSMAGARNDCQMHPSNLTCSKRSMMTRHNHIDIATSNRRSVLLCTSAGVDKQLSPAEIDALCQHYTVPKTGSMDIFSYREFLHELELIFTVPVSSTSSTRMCWPSCQVSSQRCASPMASVASSAHLHPWIMVR